MAPPTTSASKIRAAAKKKNPLLLLVRAASLEPSSTENSFTGEYPLDVASSVSATKTTLEEQQGNDDEDEEESTRDNEDNNCGSNNNNNDGDVAPMDCPSSSGRTLLLEEESSGEKDRKADFARNSNEKQHYDSDTNIKRRMIGSSSPSFNPLSEATATSPQDWLRSMDTANKNNDALIIAKSKKPQPPKLPSNDSSGNQNKKRKLFGTGGASTITSNPETTSSQSTEDINLPEMYEFRVNEQKIKRYKMIVQRLEREQKAILERRSRRPQQPSKRRRQQRQSEEEANVLGDEEQNMDNKTAAAGSSKQEVTAETTTKLIEPKRKTLSVAAAVSIAMTKAAEGRGGLLPDHVNAEEGEVPPDSEEEEGVAEEFVKHRQKQPSSAAAATIAAAKAITARAKGGERGNKKAVPDDDDATACTSLIAAVATTAAAVSAGAAAAAKAATVTEEGTTEKAGKGVSATKAAGGIIPTANDVLCGKGTKLCDHNRFYLYLCAYYGLRYIKTNKRGMAGKKGYVLRVMKQIKSKRGRFLKQNAATNEWEEISDQVAETKVAHCMRDCAFRYVVDKSKLVRLKDGSREVIMEQQPIEEENEETS